MPRCLLLKSGDDLLNSDTFLCATYEINYIIRTGVENKNKLISHTCCNWDIWTNHGYKPVLKNPVTFQGFWLNKFLLFPKQLLLRRWVVAPCSLTARRNNRQKGPLKRRYTSTRLHGATTGSKDLWNVGTLLPHYTALQPRRQPSSCSPPWEPQIILSYCYLF
jgi:hypothetical protein